MRLWRLMNWVWSGLFIMAAGWLLIRPTDGTRTVQTWPIRVVSLAVLVGFFVLVLLAQLLWRHWLPRQH